MDIIAYTKTRLYEKFGHIFYNITAVDVEFTMNGLKLQLDNLFNGIKILGRALSINFSLGNWDWEFTVLSET